jgi:hypothetical protein
LTFLRGAPMFLTGEPRWGRPGSRIAPVLLPGAANRPPPPGPTPHPKGKAVTGKASGVRSRRFDAARFTVLGLLALPVLAGCGATAASDRGGADFVAIFDGESLDGWEGDPTYWRVEDGSIVGEVTASTLLDRNSWLIWRGGVVRDFELRLEYRISALGNSGIGYRTEEVSERPYALRGYQADLDGRNRYTGMNYEELKRTTLASQGEKVLVPAIADAGDLAKYTQANDWTPSVVDSVLGHPDSLDVHVRALDWNEYHLAVRGNRMRHYVNGVLMSDVTDEDTVNRSFEGLLGVQVHVGPPMKVEYRNLRLWRLD